MVTGLGFPPEQAAKFVERAFGWGTQAFWRHQKVCGAWRGMGQGRCMGAGAGVRSKLRRTAQGWGGWLLLACKGITHAAAIWKHAQVRRHCFCWL